MLNDKHTNLKNTVSEVNKTVKEAEATVTNFQKLSVETIKEEKVQTETVVIPAKEKESQNPEKKQKRVTKVAKETKTGQDTVLLPESESIGANKNEQILELYRQGKSNVVIAKTLGLGVGEVKLVIDLYKNS